MAQFKRKRHPWGRIGAARILLSLAAIAVALAALIAIRAAPMDPTAASAASHTTLWLPLGLRLAGPDDALPPASPRPTPAVDRSHAFLPNDTIDVEHYHVTLWLREQAPIDVPVRAELRIRARTDLDFVDLDAQPESLMIHQVRVGGLPVAWKLLQLPPSPPGIVPGMLRLPLRATAAAGEVLVVRIDYTIRSASMGEFGALRFNPGETQTRALFTATWPAGTRHWLPSNDHPSDGATFSFDLHVPPDSVGAASGGLVEGDYVSGSGLDAEGLRLFRWRLGSEVPPYAAAIAIGRFKVDVSEVCYNVSGDLGTRVSCDADAQHRLPLVHYHAPIMPDLPAFAGTLDRVADSVVRYAAILGPYPFEKLGYVTAAGNPTIEYASLVSQPSTAAARHETIHMWWGNSVRIATWGDFWISEGITTYFEYYYNELMTGQRVANRSNQGAMVRPPGSVPLHDSTAYVKGAAAVYDLRQRIARLLGKSMDDPEARAAFHRVMGGLWRHFRGQALRTSELTAYLRATLATTIGPPVTAAQGAATMDEWHRQWVLPHRTTLELRLPDRQLTLDADEAQAWLPQLSDTGPITARLALYGDACNDLAGQAKPPEQVITGTIALITGGFCTTGQGVANAAAGAALAVVSTTGPNNTIPCPAQPCDDGPAIPAATIVLTMEERIVGWLRSGIPITATLQTDVLEVEVP
jgi:hypothetical protein